MRMARLDFCKKYDLRTAAEWSTVMFSDESSFEQFNDCHSIFRRPIGAQYIPR